jgi:hypothetical protein
MPKIDGRLSDGEWEEAIMVPLTDGGQLYMMHAGGYLFLAIRGDEQSFGSVCRYRNGRVVILHTSASYTTWVYALEADAWLMQSMIIGTYHMQLPESLWQEQHLKDQGWTASTFDDGNPGEIEYQIRVAGAEAILAVASVYGFGDSTLLYYETWPEYLDDDCGRMELATVVPDTSRLQFSPETWVKVVLVED